MRKIGQNPKIGQLWCPVLSNVTSYRKVDRYRKLRGPCTTTWNKQYLSAVYPLTCSLLQVRCLFDPLQASGFGANDLWMETFHKFLSKSAFLPRFMCHGQIWRKSAVAKLPISYLVLLTKNRRQGTLFSPQFRPTLPIAPKISWTLSALELFLCTDFDPDRLRFAGLIPERVQKSQHN